MNDSVGDTSTVEFGDFQTPTGLAEQVVDLLAKHGVSPRAILEPTVGVGNLLLCALHRFQDCRTGVGVEIRKEYAAEARRRAVAAFPDSDISIRNDDIFTIDVARLIKKMPSPLLIVGNPPWVTNARLGTLGSTNLPPKTNFQGHVGLDGVTGRSNFDVSEWIIITLLEAISGTDTTLAMLCKTGVARKVMRYASVRLLSVCRASTYNINVKAHFHTAVDACLFVCHGTAQKPSYTCKVFPSLGAKLATSRVEFTPGGTVADAGKHRDVSDLAGVTPIPWRSGIKHDCSKVMELVPVSEGTFRNGLGELVELERDYVYPMLKSSDVANGRVTESRLWMLVPQRRVGEATDVIRTAAPKTWRYLVAHQEVLSRRASSIYRNRPDFSIFGVGDYTFCDWKVAISGLYKRLRFSLVGPLGARPVVFDDTCYFLPCRDEVNAKVIFALLSSGVARGFYESLIFWGDKRPITKDVLGRLDIRKLVGRMVGDLRAEFMDRVVAEVPEERAVRELANIVGGVTGVACEVVGHRRCVLFELDPTCMSE